jgi:hypothetical protein
MDERRKRLIQEIEQIIGSECYNGNIQNWGPNGVFEGEGREFRYPVCFGEQDGKPIKRWSADLSMPWDTVKRGHYRFGANQLHIMRALDQVLSHLEANYGLNIKKAAR